MRTSLQRVSTSLQWLRTHLLQKIHYYSNLDYKLALSPATIEEMEKHNQHIELLQEMVRQDYNEYKRQYKVLKS